MNGVECIFEGACTCTYRQACARVWCACSGRHLESFWRQLPGRCSAIWMCSGSVHSGLIKHNTGEPWAKGGSASPICTASMRQECTLQPVPQIYTTASHLQALAWGLSVHSTLCQEQSHACNKKVCFFLESRVDTKVHGKPYMMPH